MKEDKPDGTKYRHDWILFLYIEGQAVSMETLCQSDYKIGAHLGYPLVKDLQNKQLKVHEVK